jgi:TPR repeat protein
MSSLLHKAQSNLGCRYQLGDGVVRNITKAIELYTLAAKQGLPKGYYNLALLY